MHSCCISSSLIFNVNIKLCCIIYYYILHFTISLIDRVLAFSTCITIDDFTHHVKSILTDAISTCSKYELALHINNCRDTYYTSYEPRIRLRQQLVALVTLLHLRLLKDNLSSIHANLNRPLFSYISSKVMISIVGKIALSDQQTAVVVKLLRHYFSTSWYYKHHSCRIIVTELNSTQWLASLS